MAALGQMMDLATPMQDRLGVARRTTVRTHLTAAEAIAAAETVAATKIKKVATNGH